MATRKPQILFIGYGHLAKSLLSSKILKNYYIHYINSKNSIFSIKDKKTPKKLDYNYDYIFLLIRPDVFKKIGKDFLIFTENNPTIISCMAGISINSISQTLNSKKVIRIMPNVMASNNKSQTHLYVKNKKLMSNNLIKLLSSFGKIINVRNEDQINLATSIYGSGPAFIAYIVSSFVKATKKLAKPFNINEIEVLELFKNVLEINTTSKMLDSFISSISSKKGTTKLAVINIR